MSDQDDYYYLQPGFDLSTLTIPRLRSILVAHNVTYPSSAKKADLIDIVQQEIMPKAKRLLSAQARVKRTSRGITDVPSSQDSTISDDEEVAMPPPPPPKTPRGRKSKSNMTIEDEIVPTPRTARKSKTPSGRKSTKARSSDTETDADQTVQSVRRTRKSIPGPIPVPQQSVRLDATEPRYSRKSLAAGESPFSDDNPFQSGSSPPSSSRLDSTSRTRKSISGKRKSTSRTSDTTSPQIKQEEIDGTRSTYEVPISRLGFDSNGIEITEEFTPDAEHELEEELVSNKQLARSRNSALTRTRKQPVSTVAKTAPFAVLTTVLAALGAWYRQEKISIGYCGIGEPNWSLSSNPNIPVWIHDNLQPQCEPCPTHAICFPNMDVKCEDDFILQSHPLSLNGLVPLAPTCEPDSEKERRIKAVADRAIEELREQRAVYECGGDSSKEVSSTDTTSTTNTVATKLEISEETLKQEVSKMRRKGMSSEEFEDLWRGALGDIISRDEVDVIRDGSGRLLLSSKSFARLPLSCALRRSFVRTLSRNRIPLAFVTFTVLLVGYLWQIYITYNQAKAQTPSLVAMTLDRLATQAALKEDGRTGEGFISIAQLRDDVLRNVFSVRERERVWQRVRKIVEGNSNVRAATREGGKTGEWARVWEWIGPVDLAPGLEGRKSGRLINESPGQDNDVEDRKQVADSRRWDEGRPIY